jgi:tetratricopeptide (TPR) repeat protein
MEQRFHEGLCLVAGGDFDRAGAAFLDCVIAAPGSGEFVREFLANLSRQSASAEKWPNPSPADEEPIRRGVALEDWDQVLSAAPRLIASHAGHAPTLLALARACQAKGFGESEACYLRAAVRAAGDDVRINEVAAKAFARLRLFDEAIACWRKIESSQPDDPTPPREMAELTIKKSRQSAGLEGAEYAAEKRDDLQLARPRGAASKRYVIGNIERFFPTGPAASSFRLNPVQQLEAAIRERPSIPELYLRLAEVYLDNDRDYDAERLLAKAREATDRDARVQEMWEDVTIFRHARRVEIAEREVAAVSNPQTREALMQAKKERDRAELDIFRGRVKRELASAAAHYRLGLCLKRMEKLREACQAFEKALEGELERGLAALELGDCREQLGELPEALRNYRLAAERTRSPGQLAEKKDALYRAAKIALRVKLGRLARRYLAELLRIDPRHRDAEVLMQCT